MAAKLEIQVTSGDESAVHDALEAEGISAEKMVSQRFDGTGIASFIIELTPPVLTFLAGLYVSRLSANKHIAYKYKGLEIKGVSEQTLLSILRDSSE